MGAGNFGASMIAVAITMMNGNRMRGGGIGGNGDDKEKEKEKKLSIGKMIFESLFFIHATVIAFLILGCLGWTGICIITGEINRILPRFDASTLRYFIGAEFIIIFVLTPVVTAIMWCLE